MFEMPKSSEKWYKRWISAFPESWHPSDLERFYMFLSVLLARSRKTRSRFWLARNLREDCGKLSERDIERYCDIFEHIRDFRGVWKGQQARLLACNEMQETRKRLLGKGRD